ncbi:MAG TPA: hypothetical protein DCZ94_16320 [Lentisphaeria bacterium]|nr:MAG: hypothetical protein A2X48_02015 [Lentisphaerae bacterium GWF2_49_21]HBC88513.1 hypothetical protein [Lentisphaeria bacterium]
MIKTSLFAAVLFLAIGQLDAQDVKPADSAKPPIEITAIPLFESASIYVKYSEDKYSSCKIKFRLKGENDWRDAIAPDKIKEENNFSSSIVDLKENSEYEVMAEMIDSKGASTGSAKSGFKTWTSNPPIAKTINIKKDLGKGGAIEIIGEKGTPDGWIKYVNDSGAEIDGGYETDAAILVKDSAYLIFEGLKVKGGRRFGMNVSTSENIRIINCEFSGWARKGKQDLARKGQYFDENDQRINIDGAVNIYMSLGTVIERCYMHDPRGTANPWYYSHPAGPEAVVVKSKGSTVVRYNDFIGSDLHRWNDAIEGLDNGKKDGGFNRDADIYGNMFAFGNDDGIELDGGQRHMRFFGNKVEGFLCGISTAPNMAGPTYIYRNLVVNLGDEDGVVGSVIKNGGGKIYTRGRTFFFNNIFYTDGHGISGVGYGKGENNTSDRAMFRGFSRNNILACGDIPLRDVQKLPENDFDYDLLCNRDAMGDCIVAALGAEKNGILALPLFENAEEADFNLKPGSPGIGKGSPVANFAEPDKDGKMDIGTFEQGKPGMFPIRPIPVSYDKGQVNLTADLKDKTADFATVKVNVNPGSGWKSNFKIRKNDCFDWIKVEPETGILSADSPKEFKVSIDMDKIKSAGLHKGLFLVKFDDGFSIPVTVYGKAYSKKFSVAAGTDKLEMKGNLKKMKVDGSLSEEVILMQRPENAAEFADYLEYSAEIPEEGNYYFHIRIKATASPVGSHDSLYFSIDGEKPKRIDLSNSLNWTWTKLKAGIPENRDRFATKLSAGKHVFKLIPREALYLDRLEVSADPLPSEK